jgi:hypothetical protein
MDNNEIQDLDQYLKKYESLKKKEKGTTLNKTKRVNVQFIPNNNYDYSADTDEFVMSNLNQRIDDELIGNVNKISSIQMKNNNINQIDKNSLQYLTSKTGQLWIGASHVKKRTHQNCFTEPDELYNKRTGSFLNNMNNSSLFPMSMTPQKHRQENLSMNLIYGNNLNNQINFANTNTANNESVGSSNSNIIPNFPRIINSGSIISNISTQYSSNNKKKRDNFNQDYEDENDPSMEILDGNSVNEEYIFILFFRHYINVGNSNYQNKSEKKRLPTSESIESNQSAQYNYFKNHSKIIGVNLSSQFSSGGNHPAFIDEE